jgi:hypothetical protein
MEKYTVTLTRLQPTATTTTITTTTTTTFLDALS